MAEEETLGERKGAHTEVRSLKTASV